MICKKSLCKGLHKKPLLTFPMEEIRIKIPVFFIRKETGYLDEPLIMSSG